VAAGVLGALGLAGWVFGIPALTTLHGRPPMMPSTGMALLIAAAGVALRRRRGGSIRKISVVVSGACILTLGALTLGEYALNADLGVDLEIRSMGSLPHPGRPSPLTSLAFVLLGSGLVLFDVRPRGRVWPTEWLALGAAFVGYVSLVAHAYGAQEIYRFGSPVVGVAFGTAFGLVFLALGVLLLGDHRSMVATLLLSSSPGGMLLRWLGLAAVLISPLLGFMALALVSGTMLRDMPLTLAIFTTATVPLVLVLGAILAARLDRAQRALEESRNRERSLFEQSADGIFIADLDGRYTDVNQAGCAMLGRSRDEILGKDIVDLIPAEDVPRLQAVKDALLRGGVDVREWRIRRKDGTYMPVEVSTKILPDGRWEGLVRDISERIRAESEQHFLTTVGETLASSLNVEEIVCEVADLALTFICDCCIVDLSDTNGHTCWRRARTSVLEKRACVERLERIAADDLTLDVQRRTPVLIACVCDETLRSMARSEESLDLLRRIEPHCLMIVPLVRGDRLLGTVLLSRFTERRYEPRDLRLAVELARRASSAIENALLYRAAQDAVRARDKVLGIVAHDLRNPLSAAQAGTTLLLRAPLGTDRAELARRLGEIIRSSLERANHLIEDLLDVRKTEEGRLAVQRTALTVGSLIRDAIDAHAPIAAEASISLVAGPAPGVVAVHADGRRIEQVFANLIGNAIKFTPPGGVIRVTAMQQEAEVCFSITDSGVGIPPEKLQHVFDRFWQVAEADQRGAGLGLAIAKAIVEAHNGRIWAESIEGQGSTFFFTLPIAGTDVARASEGERSFLA
jgi:PAS domain S-box-containing protein